MVQDEGATDDDFSDLEESPEPDELEELLVELVVELVVDDPLVLDEEVELPPLPPRLEGLE
jgi:hypothetical protein